MGQDLICIPAIENKFTAKPERIKLQTVECLLMEIMQNFNTNVKSGMDGIMDRQMNR